MEAPLQKHWNEGRPLVNSTEVAAVYQNGRLDSIKF